MGGVSASFAFMGDVVIAEPKALIGFAGPRVIETARQTLPEGFQRTEFLLRKGAIDMIVDRRDLRERLSALITLLQRIQCQLIPETLDGWLGYIGSPASKFDRIGSGPRTDGQGSVKATKNLSLDYRRWNKRKGLHLRNDRADTPMCRGYHVGLYTSPHLLCYNERVRVDGVFVDDAVLCKAFQSVEHAREGIPLTYFEFGTLAAWEVFSECKLDAVILEVGLGGRLDAVNAYDADCSVIVSVDLDHMEYLGTTRDQIGYEKAGIFRAKKTAICGDINPPESLIRYALAIDARLQLIGQDFHSEQKAPSGNMLA